MNTVSLLLQFPPIPNSVKWIGAAITTLAAGIAAYKFFLQRPNLQLEAEIRKDRSHRLGNRVKAFPTFYIHNIGQKFAEDVYLEISLDSWKFGEDHRGVEIGTNVSITNQDDSDIENDDDHKKESNDNDAQENFGEINCTDSVLDVKHDYVPYLGTSGELNQLFIENVIYDDTKFRLFYVPLELDPNEKYRLDYKVGCQSYGLKEGVIEFDTKYDSIDVIHDHPKPWWALRQWLNELKPEFLTTPDVWISSGTVSFEQAGFYEVVATPRTVVGISQNSHGAYSVDAKATLYLGAQTEENIVGTFTLSADSLKAGEIWIPTYSTNKYIRPNPNADYQSLQNIPFILSSRYLSYIDAPIVHPPRQQLNVEWTVDYKPQRSDPPRGIELVDDEMTVSYRQADGPDGVHVTGRLENSSTRDQTFFVVIKFYDRQGFVVATPYERCSVEAGNATSITIAPNFKLNECVHVSWYEAVLHG